MQGSFVADPQIQQVAEAYALDVLDLAKARYQLDLDFSDASLYMIELILGLLHDQAVFLKPTPEEVEQHGVGFGSYIGEVFRRNHGATWGLTTMDGEEYCGMQGTAGNLFWPWGKAQKRLENGPEDNVWHYFQVMAYGYVKCWGDPDE